jgi:ubiquinone/menaquinone biosynthesis C-methylase UbiE
MFFEDRVVALREMKRVLRRGGRMAVAVWDALDHCPGYAALAKSLDQLFGEPVAHAFPRRSFWATRDSCFPSVPRLASGTPAP